MQSHVRILFTAVLALAGLVVLLRGAPIRAQEWDWNRDQAERGAPERVNERDLRSFDAFLDRHWETADELYRDPELINNERFLRGHSELREWLDDHPEAAAAIQANPRRYLWRERTEQARRSESAQRAPARRAVALHPEDLRSFERYLDTHAEVANALYQNPELINDRRFVRANPSLEEWLDDHPEAADAIRANPHKVLWRDRRSTTAEDFLRQLLQ
jgi:hypothetical protein